MRPDTAGRSRLRYLHLIRREVLQSRYRTKAREVSKMFAFFGGVAGMGNVFSYLGHQDNDADEKAEI